MTQAIEFDPDELGGLVEATHDNLLQRLYLATHPRSQYRDSMSLDQVNLVLWRMGQTYAKAFAAYMDMVEQNPPTHFLATFQMPAGVWDLLAIVSNAKTWEDVPLHLPEPDCEVCAKFMAVKAMYRDPR